MRQTIALISVLFLLFIYGATVAAEENGQPLQDWLYYKDIQIKDANDYAFFFLDKDIYAHANSGLDDLRVIDSQDQFVPYYIMKNTGNSEVISADYQVNPLQTFVKENNTNHDFEIITSPNQDVLLNTFLVGIDSQSYLFKTRIYGSYDNINWRLIGSYKIYRVDDIEKNTIEFDEALKYPYYRFVLINNVEQAAITSMAAQYSEKVEMYQQYARTTPLKYDKKVEERTTRIVINNPYRLNIKTINLKSSGNFYRHYQLQGIANGSSQGLNSGTIYATAINDDWAEDTSINISNSYPFPEFELIIYDQDDEAVNLLGIEATYFVDKLVFPCQPGESYRLVYGNQTAKKPVYDIENYKLKIEKAGIAEAALGQEKAPQVEKSSMPESYGKIIFNIIIIIISICLIVVIAGKLRAKD